jgi:L-lactate dehydrogenase
MYKPTVFIIGAGGMVGATTASALAFKETVSNLVLIDIAEELVEAHATDLNHAAGFNNHNVHVRSGTYEDLHDNDIVIVTCGAPQKPGQTRLDLLSMNVKILRSVVSKIKQQGKMVYLLIVANPVDVLTYVAIKESGLPKERVFGSGTSLDTARLRTTLARVLRVHTRDIEAYVLGEHGDSSFPALSSAKIGGVALADFPGFTAEMTATIDQDIRNAAYKIVAAKTASKYGIGAVVSQLVEALTYNDSSIFTVSSLVEGEYGLSGVAIGLPCLISSQGVRILDHYPLSDTEKQKLNHSADIIKAAINEVTA